MEHGVSWLANAANGDACENQCFVGSQAIWLFCAWDVCGCVRAVRMCVWPHRNVLQNGPCLIAKTYSFIMHEEVY